jgi:glycosyltransferase involved in cell wall biosynthesis
MTLVNTLNVLALSPYPIAGPSARYRVYAYRQPMQARGINLDIRPFLSPKAFELRMNGKKYHPLVMVRIVLAVVERLWQARLVNRKYDLIYIHRQTVPFIHQRFDALFLQAGLPIVFDMDDAVFTEYSIDQLLQGSAAATVGNAYLAEYVRRISPRTHVAIVPTVVDTDVYTPKILDPAAQRLVVGWIGTASTFRRYLMPVLPRLVGACRAAGAEFRVIASTDIKETVEMAGAVFVPWNLQTEVDELKRFDVGVMPLTDDDYVRGKCAFKLIQYGAVGIPGVGTHIGANSEVVQDGISGYLTNSPEEMVSRLETLLEDARLRGEMGVAARRTVENRFSLSSQVDVLERVFRTVVGEGKNNVRN